MLAAILGLDLVILIALVGVPIWAIIDAAMRPTVAWQAAGQSKVLWIALVAIGTLLTGLIGVILAIVYLAAIRPKVRAATL